MKRYSGAELPSKPKIALISNDALGNFAVATPVAQLLRSNLDPTSLIYFGGQRIQELATLSPLFDESIVFHGLEPETACKLPQQHGSFDLVLNIESSPASKMLAAALAGESGYVAGPSVGEGSRGDLPFPDDPEGRLWEDRHWIAEDIREKYPFLNSGFIAEIFCRCAYLVGPLPKYRIPSVEPGTKISDVIISTSASLESKLWARGSWKEVVRRIRDTGRLVGLVGAAPGAQSRFWNDGDTESALIAEGLVEDWRGRLSLAEVVGALKNAELVLSLDNGIMHFAVASGVQVVALFRYGIHRLWAPPYDNLHVITPAEGIPVDRISVDEVWSKVGKALSR